MGFFLFKQKTAYEMRISDWSSDVCSSDLSQFNIAQACVHRWAENPVEGRRLAIFHENELGHRDVWTYSRLSETSNQLASGLVKMEIGRASCREGVCQYVSISVVAVSLKKNETVIRL